MFPKGAKVAAAGGGRCSQRQEFQKIDGLCLRDKRRPVRFSLGACTMLGDTPCRISETKLNADAHEKEKRVCDWEERGEGARLPAALLATAGALIWTHRHDHHQHTHVATCISRENSRVMARRCRVCRDAYPNMATALPRSTKGLSTINA